MLNMFRSNVPVLFALFVAGGCGSPRAHADAAPASAQRPATAGLPASELLAATTLPDLVGIVKPLAEYRDTGGLMLVFVDTRCPHSSAAIRQLPEVIAPLAACGVPTVLVNIGEGADAVKKAYAAGAPVVYDTSRQTQQTWNVRIVPTVVLLDSGGNLAYRGSPVWADVAAVTEKMLGAARGSIRIEAQNVSGG